MIQIDGYIEAKTDWTSSDKFNISDYNRIHGNLNLIKDTIERIYKQIETEDMEEKIPDGSYTSYWDVNYFNAFEKNVATMEKALGTNWTGFSKTFYPNGVFIDWQELNRIEKSIADMVERLNREIAGLERITFRLGTFKEIKI